MSFGDELKEILFFHQYRKTYNWLPKPSRPTANCQRLQCQNRQYLGFPGRTLEFHFHSLKSEYKKWTYKNEKRKQCLHSQHMKYRPIVWRNLFNHSNSTESDIPITISFSLPSWGTMLKRKNLESKNLADYALRHITLHPSLAGISWTVARQFDWTYVRQCISMHKTRQRQTNPVWIHTSSKDYNLEPCTSSLIIILLRKFSNHILEIIRKQHCSNTENVRIYCPKRSLL